MRIRVPQRWTVKSPERNQSLEGEWSPAYHSYPFLTLGESYNPELPAFLWPGE